MKTPKKGSRAITRAPWDDRSNLPRNELSDGGLQAYARRMRHQLTQERKHVRALAQSAADAEQRRLLIDLNRDILAAIGTLEGVIDLEARKVFDDQK